MLGYKFTTEIEAKNARQEAANFKGLPKENGNTLYWIDYNYSILDDFYYIIYINQIEEVLGQPINFEITEESEI